MNHQQNDTVYSDTLTDKAYTVQSLLNGGGVHEGPRLIAEEGTDWVFILTTAILFIFALIRYYNGKRIMLLLEGVFSKTRANQVLRESSVFNHQTFIPLLFLYIASVSIYIYIFFRDFTIPFIMEISPPLIILAIFTGYLLFTLLKTVLLSISGWYFRNTQTTFEYIHNIYLFYILVTIIVIPSIYLISYLDIPVMKWISLGAVTIVFIYRFLRGLGIGLSDTKFSVFHLFLYLCTLEILPLLVIAKILERYIFST
jgi:hypothetical protein